MPDDGGQGMPDAAMPESSSRRPPGKPASSPQAADELGARAHAEQQQQGGHVVLDRALGQVRELRDLLVRLAGQQPVEDLTWRTLSCGGNSVVAGFACTATGAADGSAGRPTRSLSRT